jgi:hypothetical protein
MYLIYSGTLKALSSLKPWVLKHCFSASYDNKMGTLKALSSLKPWVLKHCFSASYDNKMKKITYPNSEFSDFSSG